MASETAMPSRHDDIDNYDAGDLSDDPFASPPPDSATKKRKANGDGGLGIDEEVSVQKRARVPNVKLDEERLLGPAGLPKLKDRKSTRLNSSHSQISYAVFCLKKKKKKQTNKKTNNKKK